MKTTYAVLAALFFNQNLSLVAAEGEELDDDGNDVVDGGDDVGGDVDDTGVDYSTIVIHSIDDLECSNFTIEHAVNEKIKAKSAIAVAETLIQTAYDLRYNAQLELPKAIAALEAFEADIDSEAFLTANTAYKIEQTKIDFPRQDLDAANELNEALLENVTTAYNTYQAHQNSLETQTRELAELEAQQLVLLATVVENSAQQIQLELDLDNNTMQIQQKKLEIQTSTGLVTQWEQNYQNAGKAFQEQDIERALAQQKYDNLKVTSDEAHESVLAEANKITGVAEELVRLQNAVEEHTLNQEIFRRDGVRANLLLIKSQQRLIVANNLFEYAKDECQNFGGVADPAEVALQIAEALTENADIIKLLEAEEAEKRAAIIQGKDGYDCTILTVWNGNELTRPVRPLCHDGYCCGSAEGSDGGVIEQCHPVDTSTVTYQPTRAANAPTRPASETVDFYCIEGAKKVIASAAALLSTVYMLA